MSVLPAYLLSWMRTLKVTTMYAMFYYASDFNQLIGDWNTAKVTGMESLLYGAYAFTKAAIFATAFGVNKAHGATIVIHESS